MTRGQWLLGRMVCGAVVFALYGVWLVCARLPDGLPWGLWLPTAAWSIGLFTGAGTVIAATVALLAGAAGSPIRSPRRSVVAALVETVLLASLTGWMLTNELLFSVTSEVLGAGSLRLLWYNTAAVLEAAWEMAGLLLILAVGITCVTAAVGYRLSRWSWRRWSLVDFTSATPISGRSRMLAGTLTGGVALLAGLVAWQAEGRPSEAFCVLLRSAPPLRALDLPRVMIGPDRLGAAPARYGEPVITDEQYQRMIPPAEYSRPHVIYLLMESTPARALRCYGHPKPDITPHIDALAAQGTLFEHCWAPSSFSSASVTSILAGMYLLRADHFDHFADVRFPFLSWPRALKLAGYELALFSSGNETFDNIQRFCDPADFDTYFSHDTCDIPKTDCMRMDDRHAVERFEQWLSTRRDPRPFYAGFYLQSPHFNYEVPEPWCRHDLPVPPLYSNGDGILHIPPEVLPLLRNQYDNAIRYADHMVGRIVAALDAAGALDNAIIVLTGDHGEAFMEHGLARHGTHTWEEMIHTPLIIRVGPQAQRSLASPLPARVAGTVSGIDIPATVAGLIGIPAHPSWQGVDVLDPAYAGDVRPVFSMTQYTRLQEVICLNRWKYIYDATEVREYLFDLAADPGELHNRIDDQPELAAALRRLLDGWHTHQLSYHDARHQPRDVYIGRFAPDDDMLKRALSYATR